MRRASIFMLLPLPLLALTACEGTIVGERSTRPPMTNPVDPLDPTVPEPELPAFAPAPLRPRLLLGSQYVNAIADLLGPDAARPVVPPRDVPVNGLSAVGATMLEVSSSAVNDYEANAYLAAQAGLAARRSQLITCTPSSSSDATCMRTVAERFVPRAFRRPATSDELTRWTSIGVQAATAYDDFDKGVEFLFAGLLQSPAFLYLDETGETDPANPERRRLSSWELASRLSFFLTNAPPDDALRAAAESGELLTEAGVRTQAARLLQKSEARNAMTALFDEILELNGLDHLAKDSVKYPGFDAVTLGRSMKEETRRSLLDLAFDVPSSDFRDVFTRRTTFVDGPLSRHYGLTAVTGWSTVQLPANRAGLFTQASFLSLQSHPAANSPTYRGRFIREKLLCQTIPAPPPDVNTTLPAAPPNVQRTLRQKVELHMGNAGCSGCHVMMDPQGFAFEGFDATGKVQTMDDGLPIDTTGSFEDKGTFTDAVGLAAILREDPRVMSCLTRVVFRQGTGHVDLPTEARPLRAASEAFAASGYRYQTLLIELAASEAFRSGIPEAP
ncbi:MAG: DUF1592 domain-containing protein [Archangium sp.]